VGQQHLLLSKSVSSRILKGLGLAVAIGGALLVVLVLAIATIGMSGAGTARLQHETEAMIRRLAGVDVAATFGPTRISLDSSRFVALELRDVHLAATADGGEIIDAGLVRVGVRFWPLMSGDLRLGSATIGDARIVAAALPTERGPDWKATLAGHHGLISPDRVADQLFRMLHRAFDAMKAGSTRRLELDNVEIVLPEGARMRRIHIANAQLEQGAPGELAFSAEASVDGRALVIEGTAVRDEATKRITGLDLKVSSPGEDAEGDLGEIVAKMVGSISSDAPKSGTGHKLGTLELALTGEEGTTGSAPRISATLALKQSVLDLGSYDVVSDVDLQATLAMGAGKVEIDKLAVATGKSRLVFHGAFGPLPRISDDAGPPAYRYELISDGSTVAPEDSPEPVLNLLAQIVGQYEPGSHRLTADRIGIRTETGEVLGSGSFEFLSGKAPGIFLALSVPEMSVSHLKQLWPPIAAGGARRWVLNNLHGGRVTASSIQYRIPPGRLGNGVPLSHDEVSGSFKVEDTRFNLAGRMPPVRDAYGTVDFRGADVDVAVSSGTVFMASGRTVAASNGKLAVREATKRPVIGDLDIDVAGEAPAIAELASYEPINAMRHIGLAPDDFTGQVEGHVKADIPLHAGIDSGRLGWLVALNYSDLSVAKPFEGQKVTEADGTITIEPVKAVIAAKGKLNGSPAEISLIEPLRGNGPERVRDISMVLDDKARDALIPGLDSMISGTMEVNLKWGAERDKRNALVDLTAAKLSVPWAGWSKGTGVAAKATFSLEKSGEVTKLSEFNLAGQSFSIAGGITLSDGELASAHFDDVRLNRDDDVQIDIERSGRGYDVDVRGNSLDARAVMKQFMGDGRGSDDSRAVAGPEKPIPVSVDVDVDTLTGFHGERLSNVKLDYTGGSGLAQSLAVKGATSSGAPLTLRHETGGARQRIDMQSPDAGAVLRFLDIYEHMEGGSIRLALSGGKDGPLRGQVDATDFWIVNEPKLRSIVSTAPQGSDRSLNQAVKRDIDTSRVSFERGYASIEKGDGYLMLDRGVLRGPVIGTTFQGLLYDARGRMEMTGTFMPAYGINRLFGELPVIGLFLGNGRDRGLIGVTYKLSGNTKSPDLQINPLSVMAPGIFRSIFEFQ
jgi:hypothetical protein